MITVEKLEKGTYFDDAFKISFRYDPTTVAKVKDFISGILGKALKGSFVFKVLKRRDHILGSDLDRSIHLTLLIIRISLLTAARRQTKDAGNHTY